MNMTIDWKDLAARALWTFVQAFLVALPATINFDLDGAAWTSVLLSAAAAGVSAVKTFLVAFVKSNKPPDATGGN